jgi:probable HAF family extracellular repeat protein
VTDLGTLGGFDSGASGINASGQVVGWANTASGSQGCCISGDAFLYSNGIMTDLNSLLPANSGWSLLQATAINDSGQIVGSNGQSHAFLLNPISLSPSSAAPGGAAFTLTVSGHGLAPGATVNWNAVALATTYVSSTEVTAIVPAALIAMPGTASVTVTNTQGTPVIATFGIHPQRLPRVPEQPRGALQREKQ